VSSFAVPAKPGAKGLKAMYNIDFVDIIPQLRANAIKTRLLHFGQADPTLHKSRKETEHIDKPLNILTVVVVGKIKIRGSFHTIPFSLRKKRLPDKLYMLYSYWVGQWSGSLILEYWLSYLDL
jgi:hypothetical protein